MVAVKFSSLQISAIKLALFGTALLYLTGDLFIWRGPTWRLLHQQDVAVAENADAPAIVYGEVITQRHLDQFTEQQNHLRGRNDTPEGDRIPMLMEIVHDTLLRLRSRYNDKNLPDVTEMAEQEVQRLTSRAPSSEIFDRWLASQGLTRQAYTRELAARLKDMHFLQRVIESHCRVSDEDAARHYELIKNSLVQPESRSLRHIFLPTLGEDVELVRSRAEELLHALETGADFASLAKKHSADPTSAARGGDLGIVQNTEDFPLPELPLFGGKALPEGKFALAQSRWGWHIMLPGKITPARPLRFEECKESLKSAIHSAQVEIAIRAFRDSTLKEAFAKKYLEIHAN